MSVYFCKDCVSSWKKKKIMDCELCQQHLESGWTIEKLDEIYGAKQDALQFLGLQLDIVPPFAHRLPLEKLAYNNIYLLNAKILRHIITTPFHLLEDKFVKLLTTEGPRLQLCQNNQNSEQFETFLQSEFRIVHLFNLVTTHQTKQMCWQALDPLLQHVVSNAQEYVSIR